MHPRPSRNAAHGDSPWVERSGTLGHPTPRTLAPTGRRDNVGRVPSRGAPPQPQRGAPRQPGAPPREVRNKRHKALKGRPNPLYAVGVEEGSPGCEATPGYGFPSVDLPLFRSAPISAFGSTPRDASWMVPHRRSHVPLLHRMFPFAKDHRAEPVPRDREQPRGLRNRVHRTSRPPLIR